MKSAIAISSVAAVSGVNRLGFLAEKSGKKALTTGPITIFDHVFMNENVVFNLDPAGPLGGEAGSLPQLVCQEQVPNDVLDSVKVCGVNMQVTIFKNHGCEKGELGDTAKVGICNTNMEPAACIQIDSPEEGHDNIWVRRARSFVLHPCDADLAKGVQHAHAAHHAAAANGEGGEGGESGAGEGGDAAGAAGGDAAGAAGGDAAGGDGADALGETSAADKEGAAEMMADAKAEVEADDADDDGATDGEGADSEPAQSGGPIVGGVEVELPAPSEQPDPEDEAAAEALEESEEALKEEIKKDAGVPSTLPSPPGTSGSGVTKFDFHVPATKVKPFVQKIKKVFAKKVTKAKKAKKSIFKSIVKKAKKAKKSIVKKAKKVLKFFRR